MNKYQEALNGIIECYEELESRVGNDPNKVKEFDGIKTLQELVDKTTPKKLKPKTDKDGRLMLVCPTCGDVYIKFWSDVETVSCRKYCDECGQKLDWSDE